MGICRVIIRAANSDLLVTTIYRERKLVRTRHFSVAPRPKANSQTEYPYPLSRLQMGQIGRTDCQNIKRFVCGMKAICCCIRHRHQKPTGRTGNVVILKLYTAILHTRRWKKISHNQRGGDDIANITYTALLLLLLGLQCALVSIWGWASV